MGDGAGAILLDGTGEEMDATREIDRGGLTRRVEVYGPREALSAGARHTGI